MKNPEQLSKLPRTEQQRRLLMKKLGASMLALLAAGTMVGRSKAEASPVPNPEVRTLAAMKSGKIPTFAFYGALKLGIGARFQSQPRDEKVFTVNRVRRGRSAVLVNPLMVEMGHKLWLAGKVGNKLTPQKTLWVNLSSASKLPGTKAFVHKQETPTSTIWAHIKPDNTLTATGPNNQLLSSNNLAGILSMPSATVSRWTKDLGYIGSNHMPTYLIPRPNIVKPPTIVTPLSPVVVGMQPQPPVTPPPPESTPPPPEIDIVAETEKYLSTDTAYLPFMNGCSGLLIRDAKGVAIGLSTAQHCGLRTETTPRIMGSDGKLYAVMSQPLDVKTGPDVNHLRTVGVAEQAIVPQAGDPSHDLALITFQGISPSTVIAAYNKAVVQPSVGQTIYTSGYPTSQPNNSSGVTKRETMPSTYLGRSTITTTNGQTIPVNTVGMRQNSDGSICSYGNSGAEGIVPRVVTNSSGVQSVVIGRVGIDAGFDDFRSAPYNTVTAISPTYDGPSILLERERETGFNLTGYDGICDFTPDIALTTDTVKLVNSSSQIP